MDTLTIPDSFDGSEIAIIGMAGKFPGAKNIDEFWHNIENGVEAISFFSDEELLSAGVNIATLRDPTYVKARGSLDTIDQFDAYFFGFNPREASIMDPQHRLFLESAWEAIENASYDPDTYRGRIGVYGGTGMNGYLSANLLSNPDLIESIGSFQTAIGNDKDYVTTRVSYKLNLKGPSVSMNTACSTSLVAVHFACQSLLSEECDMALAGGVSITLPNDAGYFYEVGGISSSDGHCRPFDSESAGTVGGNGVGVVILKRFVDALSDRDTIYAVIRGTAINNDGAMKVGYTAPSVSGQAEVIVEALSVARVQPETVTYIETHGTGTALGDPIEIAALTQAFRASTDRSQFCAIGSVKANIGHLDVAAGIAGFIKTVLALYHRTLPPNINFEKPNPQIDFTNSPFYVNVRSKPWETIDSPRRAGISSFGIGGTNAHVILEEAPTLDTSVHTSAEAEHPWQLVTLSAKTPTALTNATTNLARYCQQHPNLSLADVCYTLQLGRKQFNHRAMLVARDIGDVVSALSMHTPNRLQISSNEAQKRSVVFMFPGWGTEYVNMAHEIYLYEPVFRACVDRCCAMLVPELGCDLRQVLYPDNNDAEASSSELKRPSLALTALFVTEYALAKLWIAWGIQFDSMIGHSLGEYVAACLAGVFSEQDALALVALRGRLFEQVPAGTMLSVPLTEQQVQSLLSDRLSLAAVNGPSSCVIGGPPQDIDELEQTLKEQGIETRRLINPVAAHSAMLEPILEEFGSFVRTIKLKPPRIPFVSDVTGTWITEAEATDFQYWVRHLRQTVRFADGIQQLLADPERTFLEVGPGRTLSTLTRQQPLLNKGHVVLNSLRHPHDSMPDLAFLLTTLGRLWLEGVPINWAGFHAYGTSRRIPLPTYPFERQRCWIEPLPVKVATNYTNHASLHKKPDIADWFYIPSWKRSLPPVLVEEGVLTRQRLRWLVFSNRDGWGLQLIQRLKDSGQDAITVMEGNRYACIGEGLYTINPEHYDDYSALVTELSVLDELPLQIVHLWNVTSNPPDLSVEKLFAWYQDRGFYSLLFLTKALGSVHPTDSLQITVVSNHLQQVAGSDTPYPEKATLLSLCTVLPQEYPHITCRSIDIDEAETNSSAEKHLLDRLVAELGSTGKDTIVAYRGQYRWVQTFEAVRINEPPVPGAFLREGGVYLITGGLGNVGLILADYLAQTVRAKLVLVGRSPLPAHDAWNDWLATHPNQDNVSRKIQRILAIEEQGTEVLVVSADVADREQMKTVITTALSLFGQINGVIHSAGIVGDQSFTPIQEVGHDECEWQFRPKVQGLLVLEEVLQGNELDFCILQSSLASILGGLGFVAYAAANLFMDAFAHLRTMTGHIRWISVNWEGWNLEQTYTGTPVPGATLLGLALTPQEGVAILQRILSTNTGPQIIISTGDLSSRISHRVKQEAIQNEKNEIKEDVQQTPILALHARPGLSNAYFAPRNETERSIAAIWQELLGIEDVGIYDNFYELGGHSLLATQVISHVRNTFNVEVPLRTFFDALTVTDLANAIMQLRAEAVDSEMLAQLLADIEQLSDEEAQLLKDNRAM